MTPKTEQTKKTMYAVLDRIRRARKHVTLTDDFELVLESHLEALRLEFADGITRLCAMTEERDEIQGRLHAVDYAFAQSDRNTAIAGDMIRSQAELIRSQREAIGEMFMQLKGLKP